MILEYFKKRKERKVKRIKLLKVELQQMWDKCDKEADDHNDWGRKYKNKQNDICPNCKSKNVIDSIKRMQGKIRGSGDFFSSSMSGKIDTNEIRKCTDCGNEWKTYDYDYKSKRDALEDKLNAVAWQLEDYYDWEHCEFDETDLNEEYNSLEEKKEALRKSLDTNYRVKEIKEFWSGASIDIFNEFVDMKDDSYVSRKIKKYYNKDRLLEMGFKELELN